MVFDFSFGTFCDHRVREEVTLIPGDGIRIVLKNIPDQHGPLFVLYKNGVDVTAGVVFEFDAVLKKVVFITAGLTFDNNLYPPDDYELEFTADSDTCPKHIKKVTIGG